MSNPQNNQQQPQPSTLPPPHSQQTAMYNQYYAQYNNPYYYQYYNAYQQPQQQGTTNPVPPPPPAQSHHTSNNPPPPPPPNAYYGYYNQYQMPQSQSNQPPAPPPPPNSAQHLGSKPTVSFTWNRNPNNPPPPPPKPTIAPNHGGNHNKQMVSSSSPSSLLSTSRQNNNDNNINNTTNNHSNGKKDHIPPALQSFMEKCLHRFKQLPHHIATQINKQKLQKQLRSQVQTAKLHGTLWTTDWSNQPFPPHLRHLIDLSSPNRNNKRKADSEWRETAVIRKVAKTSLSHREVHQMNTSLDKETRSFLESPPPSFVSTSNRNKSTKKAVDHRNNLISFENNHDADAHDKCDSDMSVSASTSPPPKINGNINFSIKRNPRTVTSNDKKIQFKNPFTMDMDEDDTDDSDNEAFVISKGRGHVVRKVKKTKKSKKKRKEDHGFTWNDSNGIDALNTSSTNSKQDPSELDEINRILERKKRFESKGNTDNHNNNVSKAYNTKSKKMSNSNLLNGKRLSKDMQQMMDWHSKRIVGTCTKVEKDYFRLTSEPQPSEVRTLDTLKKAFSLLMIRWKTKNKRDYLYVGGQFKSLRQDLRVQHIRNEFSVKVYEENAKICLEVGDLSEYNQCQGQLKELYKEMELFGANYIEFLSYRLLYEAVTKNFHAVSCIIKIEKKYCKHQEIKDTLKIITAIQRTDYNTFFKLYKKLRYHGQCILDQIIYKLRYQTLCRISVSYSPSTYPVRKLMKIIGFEDEKECVTYLRHTGCILTKANNNRLMLNCKASRGKIKEFVPKAKDDELGVTHGSVYHSKNQEETTIHKFLRKT